MPQITLSIDGLKSISKRLNQLIDNVEDMEPVFERIGQYMQGSVQNRILRQKRSPDGDPWAPLKPSTIKRKGGRSSILFDTGALAYGIYMSDVDGEHVTVSTGPNTPYGYWMQNGTKDGKVPARPYMGISSENVRRITRLISDHITKGG
jgi:phage virion morphogenesis protein